MPQSVQDDKYINDANKTAENGDKLVVDAWAINVIQSRSGMNLDGIATADILKVAESVGVKLKLNEETGVYTLDF